MSKTMATNPSARHNYFIEDTLEAGIVLVGTEVKSIRKGRVNIKDSYVSVKNSEVFVHNMHITPYDHGNINNKNPLRDRKLLLNKKEILKLIGYTKQKGLTLVPLSLYFKDNFIKLELGICKGKKLYDKRQEIAKKDANLNIRRQMLEKNRKV